jgi:hypothetical protein
MDRKSFLDQASFGIGATLLSLIIGAYASNLFVRSVPYFIATEISGSDPVSVAAKGIVNPLVNNVLGITSAASQLIFLNPLMTPFTIATLGLAVSAFYLGWIRK